MAKRCPSCGTENRDDAKFYAIEAPQPQLAPASAPSHPPPPRSRAPRAKTPAPAAPTAGNARPSRANTLRRYETHLDRKFKRTLAMLFTLGEYRTRGDTRRK